MEEIAFTARPKIKSQSQIDRYGQRIFCLPHRPKIQISLICAFIWCLQSVIESIGQHLTPGIGRFCSKRLCNESMAQKIYYQSPYSFSVNHVPHPDFVPSHIIRVKKDPCWENRVKDPQQKHLKILTLFSTLVFI